MLGDSRHMALRRLIQIEAKFKRDPEYHQQYIQFMRDLIDLGHMIRAAPLKPGTLHCYISHHAVPVDRKFRVVFDGSVKTTNGESHKIQKDLLDTVLSFRMGRIALSADIVKMYSKVRVMNTQWDLQQILWKENPTEPIVEYWLITVTYGEAAAPFMAVSALNQCAEDFKNKYPRASQIVKNNFSMDDLLCAVETIQEVHELKQELIDLLAKGGFELAKWTSNSALLAGQDSDFKEINEADSSSVLGVFWDYDQDQFQLKVQTRPAPRALTKRVVASESARIFDPQGYLSPVTVRAKLFIQELIFVITIKENHLFSRRETLYVDAYSKFFLYTYAYMCGGVLRTDLKKISSGINPTSSHMYVHMYMYYVFIYKRKLLHFVYIFFFLIYICSLFGVLH